MIKYIIVVLSILVSIAVLGVTYNKTSDNEKQIKRLSFENEQSEEKMDVVIRKLDRIYSCLEQLESKL